MFSKVKIINHIYQFIQSHITDSSWSTWSNQVFHYSLSFVAQFSGLWASLGAQLVKNRPAILETWVLSLGWEDPLEKGLATHSSILSWRIPWTEEPGRLQSMGLQKVGRDWTTKTSSILHMVMYVFKCYSFNSSHLSYPHCVHKSVLYVCISIAGDVIWGLKLPSFLISNHKLQ